MRKEYLIFIYENVYFIAALGVSDIIAVNFVDSFKSEKA